MRKIITLALITVLTFIAFNPINCRAEDEEQVTVTLSKQKKEPQPKPDNDGPRIPPRHVICIISQTGMHSSIDSDEIIDYEIWDKDGVVCFASYIDDQSFCQYLFNVPGNYQIRIATDDYVYVGYISTL